MSGNGNHLKVPSYNMDGPGDDDTQSRRSGRNERAGSVQPRPRRGSAQDPDQGGGQAGGQWPQGLGFDPARAQKQQAQNKPANSRLELPADAFGEQMTHPFARRPGFGALGTKINIAVNQFPITRIAATKVYLYDLSVQPNSLNDERVIKKCWQSPTMQKNLTSNRQHIWLYNGRNLAWSTDDLAAKGGQVRQMLDLDQEYGRARPGGRENRFYLQLKRVGEIHLNYLKAYLEGKAGFSNDVLECLNFLDHVLRQGPSERMLSIKRNFYPKTTEPFSMGDNVIEVVKGIFASIRLSQSIQRPGGLGLGVNVDVANTCFWVAQNFEDLVKNYLVATDRRFNRVQLTAMYDILKPTRAFREGTPDNAIWCESDAFKALRKLHKLHFTVKHRGKSDDRKTYTVKRFTFDKALGEEGSNAKNYKFTKKDGQTISVFEHFQKQYNIRLMHWKLPLIETSRGGVFPMEVCSVDLYQRYPFKLDPDQTAKMIKFAVTRPDVRGKHIMNNVRELKWAEDRYLKHFGIQISSTMATAPARIIQNPEIQYGNGKINPQMSGRWDLRGKTFSQPGTLSLDIFGVIVVDNCVDKAATQAFTENFLRIFKAHGGRVGGKPFYQAFSTKDMNIGALFEKAYTAIGNAHKRYPQMIFFILPNKNVLNYERLKKSADCRYAIVTQCLQAQHVQRNQPQYCSNVAMKVNAKLGGQTCRLAGSGSFSRPTMIIGVDVSHASPGANNPSMAAVSVSMDKEAARYAGAVETNGYRCEILIPANIRNMFQPLIERWKNNFRGLAPEHVFYFRDGVSEGQFAHVMELEIGALRKLFLDVTGKEPKFTVIVATKRHHIRFFPKAGDRNAADRNNNPLPGTIVEHEVTHPFHYDFYLCSHVAIQGTARPVHYHILHDEAKMKPDDLQKIIYHQCYQYVRSTTPVSLHPAVYYAHLLSNRARCHENTWSDPAPKKERGAFAKGEDTDSNRTGTDASPLLPIGVQGLAGTDNVNHFKGTMWYV